MNTLISIHFISLLVQLENLGCDNWGLKRHLNTHTKPFVCLLCDYKAARSERLTTHILKVHNKKACNKCSFFADDQAQLAQHQIDSQWVVLNLNINWNGLGNSTNNKITLFPCSQNEARVNNARVNNPPTNNNPTQTIVTNQNIINQPTSSNILNPVAANISASTGNVLRTLTNTLVPNIHTTTSNHVFGWAMVYKKYLSIFTTCWLPVYFLSLVTVNVLSLTSFFFK